MPLITGAATWCTPQNEWAAPPGRRLCRTPPGKDVVSLPALQILSSNPRERARVLGLEALFFQRLGNKLLVGASPFCPPSPPSVLSVVFRGQGNPRGNWDWGGTNEPSHTPRTFSVFWALRDGSALTCFARVGKRRLRRRAGAGSPEPGRSCAPIGPQALARSPVSRALGPVFQRGSAPGGRGLHRPAPPGEGRLRPLLGGAGGAGRVSGSLGRRGRLQARAFQAALPHWPRGPPGCSEARPAGGRARSPRL